MVCGVVQELEEGGVRGVDLGGGGGVEVDFVDSCCFWFSTSAVASLMGKETLGQGRRKAYL